MLTLCYVGINEKQNLIIEVKVIIFYFFFRTGLMETEAAYWMLRKRRMRSTRMATRIMDMEQQGKSMSRSLLNVMRL